jgi:hypothetical protein
MALPSGYGYRDELIGQLRDQHVLLHLLTAAFGTKGAFAAMPKWGRVLGVLLTLPAHSGHSGL